MTKLKAFADDRKNVAQMMISVFNRVEKRRKCWLPAFSSFLTMFSKGFFLGIIKSHGLSGKSKVFVTASTKKSRHVVHAGTSLCI